MLPYVPGYDTIYDGQRVIFIKNDQDLRSLLDAQIQENKLLKVQLKAQTDRADFIEDCLAEMAGVVYNTEETTT